MTENAMTENAITQRAITQNDRQEQSLRRFFIVLLALAVVGSFVWMIRGFLTPLFLGAVFSALVFPLFNRTARLLGGRRRLAASLTLFLLVFAVLLPGVGVSLLLADQAQNVADQAIPWVEEQMQSRGPAVDLPDWFPFRAELEQNLSDVTTKLGEFSSSISRFFVGAVSALTAGAARLFLDLFVMLFAMFYFLTNGPQVLERVRKYASVFAGVQDRVFDRILIVSRATIRGTLLIGVVQGVLGGLGLFFAGIEGAVFWGSVMAILSVLPVVGGSLVWIPAAIYLLASGEYVAAIGLVAWSAVVVSNIDNVLRPVLVGNAAKLPDLVVLVSTLSGLAMFGGAGLVIGPVLAAVSLTFLDITVETLSDAAPSDATASGKA